MNKEMFLDGIHSQMRLTWDIFKSIYGFDLSFPGFAENALEKLEAAGCSKAREYYAEWVKKYQNKRNAELKEAARRYFEKLCDERKAEEKEVKTSRKNNLQAMNREELTALCRKLLEAGIITDVSQFVTMVQQGY